MMSAMGQAVKPLGEDTTKRRRTIQTTGKDGPKARHRKFLEFIKQPFYSRKL